MNTKFRSERGLSEVRGFYGNALAAVGRQDGEGNTIGIAYVAMPGLRLVPLALRTVGFLVLLLMVFVRQPFTWIGSIFPNSEMAMRLASWEIFSLTTWAVAVAVYLLYYGVNLWKNSMYKGQSGSVTHLQKFGKIVRSVKPGERVTILDPREQPLAVVSTQGMVLQLPAVTGVTQDNHSLTTLGALVIRIVDSFRLLERGGFENFIRQLEKSYESCMTGMIQAQTARTFNQFLIEPVQLPQVGDQTFTDALETIGQNELSVDLLMKLTEIKEVDVSKLNLSEHDTATRAAIVGSLQELARSYGIEVVDFVPQGNQVKQDYLESLALPMVSAITRIRQSTATLRDMTEEMIAVEINSLVAGRQLSLLEIQRVIAEIKSVIEALGGEGSAKALIEAREKAMDNEVTTRLASTLAILDALQAELKAQEVDTAAIERYLDELDAVYTDLEAKVKGEDGFIPRLSVVSHQVTSEIILPNVDLVKEILERSGTKTLLDSLEAAGQEDSSAQAAEELLKRVEETLTTVSPDKVIEELAGALNSFTTETGVSLGSYTPETVKERVEAIVRQALTGEMSHNPQVVLPHEESHTA